MKKYDNCKKKIKMHNQCKKNCKKTQKWTIFIKYCALVELNILVPDSNYAKLSYRYNEIYNVFVGKDMY